MWEGLEDENRNRLRKLFTRKAVPPAGAASPGDSDDDDPERIVDRLPFFGSGSLVPRKKRKNSTVERAEDPTRLQALNELARDEPVGKNALGALILARLGLKEKFFRAEEEILEEKMTEIRVRNAQPRLGFMRRTRSLARLTTTTADGRRASSVSRRKKRREFEGYDAGVSGTDDVTSSPTATSNPPSPGGRRGRRMRRGGPRGGRKRPRRVGSGSSDDESQLSSTAGELSSTTFDGNTSLGERVFRASAARAVLLRPAINQVGGGDLGGVVGGEGDDDHAAEGDRIAGGGHAAAGVGEGDAAEDHVPARRGRLGGPDGGDGSHSSKSSSTPKDDDSRVDSSHELEDIAEEALLSADDLNLANLSNVEEEEDTPEEEDPDTFMNFDDDGGTGGQMLMGGGTGEVPDESDFASGFRSEYYRSDGDGGMTSDYGGDGGPNNNYGRSNTRRVSRRRSRFAEGYEEPAGSGTLATSDSPSRDGESGSSGSSPLSSGTGPEEEDDRGPGPIRPGSSSPGDSGRASTPLKVAKPKPRKAPSQSGRGSDTQTAAPPGALETLVEESDEGLVNGETTTEGVGLSSHPNPGAAAIPTEMLEDLVLDDAPSQKSEVIRTGISTGRSRRRGRSLPAGLRGERAAGLEYLSPVREHGGGGFSAWESMDEDDKLPLSGGETRTAIGGKNRATLNPPQLSLLCCNKVKLSSWKGSMNQECSPPPPSSLLLPPSLRDSCMIHGAAPWEILSLCYRPLAALPPAAVLCESTRRSCLPPGFRPVNAGGLPEHRQCWSCLPLARREYRR